MGSIHKRVSTRRKLALAVVTAALSAFSGPATHADVTATYTGPASGSWNNLNNWSGGVVPNNGNGGQNYLVVIDGNTNQASTVSLDSSVTVNGLTLDTGDILNIANAQILAFNGGTFTNNGVVNLLSVGSGFTQLVLNANTLLTGGGTINLQSVSSIHGAFTLTNSGNTIQGEASYGNFNGIGNNETTIINQAGGIINANISGAVLLVDPGTSGLTNTGLLEATNGGILRLTGNGGGSYINNGGSLLATGASSTVDLTNGASVAGGLLTAANGGIIQVGSNTNAALSNLTIQGQFVVQNGGGANVSGTITNTGYIQLNSAGSSFTRLTLSADTTLTGGGTISLQQVASIDGTFTLTNVNNIIQGEANYGNSNGIGNNQTAIINQANGIIDATITNATLLVDPGTLGLTNTGLLRASNGGNLLLTGNGGGAFNNAGGIIRASGSGPFGTLTAFSTVSLVNNAAINGGTLTSDNGGFVQIGNAATLTDLTINGTLVIQNANVGTFNGIITNQGNIQLNSQGSGFTRFALGSDVILTGGGTISLQSIASIEGNYTLTNVNNIIQGEANHGGANGIGNNQSAIVNQANGIIDANVTGGSLIIDPGTLGLSNTGLLRARNGGNLRLTGNGGGTFNNTGGVIRATGSAPSGSLTLFSTVSLLNGATINGGTLTSDTGAFFQVTDAATVNDLTIQGSFVIQNGATNTFNGIITNQGNIQLNSQGSGYTRFVLGSDVTLTGGGTVTLQSISYLQGTHTLTNFNNLIQGEASFSNNGIGLNEAVILNQAAGVINANVSGKKLVLDPAPSGGLTNQGLMEATNGGILQLTGNGGGTFNNSNAIILASGAGSYINLFNGADLSGGTLTSASGGYSQVDPGDSAFLGNLTLGGTLVVQNAAILHAHDTINNTGQILFNSVGASYTRLHLDADTTLTGGGTVTLQSITYFDGAHTLINADNTLQGEASFNGQGFGTGDLAIVNQVAGIIDANIAGKQLIVFPGAGGFTNAGVARASNGGILLLKGPVGAFTNNGTYEALDGSSILLDSSALLTNNVTGTLTGGTYRSVSTGSGATITLRGNPLLNLAPTTTVELNGAGSVLQVVSTAIETTLAQNNGTLKVLGARNYTTALAFTNAGTLQLGGGTWSSASLTNAASGLITGFGTVALRPLNHGIIAASGGTLAFTNGIQGGSGTLQANTGATLDISAGASDSSGDFLILQTGGSLNLGNNNVLVSAGYANANFGIGNAFNKHANVSTTGGKILAAGTNVQVTTGDLAAGDQPNPLMDFGHIHVGDTKSFVYQVNNIGVVPASGPAVLYAVQTSANGGNLTDPRLSGSGVTAQNLGPVALGSATAAQTVNFSGLSAGSLTAQTIHIANNFDGNTAATSGTASLFEQTVSFTGAAYRLANPVLTGSPISFGNFHEGTVSASGTYALTNNLPADGFSESLDASITTASGPIAITGAVNQLAPGGTSNAFTAALSGNLSAGHYAGSATLKFVSNGAGSSGLGLTTLGLTPVSAAADVYRLAQPSLTGSPIDLGNFHEGSVSASNTYSLSNTAANDGFSESLDASVTSPTGPIAITGNVSQLAPGGSSTALSAALSGNLAAGHYAGSALIKLVSNGAGSSGLGLTTLSLTPVSAAANVYRLAAPATVPNIHLGIIHVNDNGSAHPQITNNVPNDGFSENLIAAFSSSSGATTSAGSVTLSPGQVNSSGLTITLPTAVASLSISGTGTLHFQSDGTGSSGLGNTSLAGQDQTISVDATILNYASTALRKDAGDGFFALGTNSATLDLGNILAGTQTTSTLAALNAAIGPSDTLAGNWDLSGAPGEFALTGFTSFANIAAGQAFTDLGVSFLSNDLGLHTATVVLHPFSQNAAPSSTPLDDYTLTITANVTVPEPTSLALIATALPLLVRRRRKLSR